jgi:opacity protein-like surface antigen
MRRLLTFAGIVLIGTLAMPTASYAQQSVNFYLGGFVPRNFDARDRDDVLLNNDFLAFRMRDFFGVTFGGEWLVGLGENFDAGLGVGFYSKTVPTIYNDYVNVNGDEIEQDLKLRVVPFTATIRYLPLGRSDAFEPYIGAGVGVLRYRYTEVGDFVDFNDNNSIFNDEFVGTGAATGPVILGGARFPVGSVSVGGEIRYQYAKGDLPRDQGFSGRTIDLGGFSYLATVKLRF